MGKALVGMRSEIGISDGRFPDALRAIPCPPERLYVVGNISALSPGLAVVGARKATPYGLSCAHRFARLAAEKGVTIISVTENLTSPLALGADIVIPMSITRETDRYNSQGTTSFTVLSVIFDALQTALIEVTGYQNESFALIHPGGAVGARLNARG
jgi:hypothetical protein